MDVESPSGEWETRPESSPVASAVETLVQLIGRDPQASLTVRIEPVETRGIRLVLDRDADRPPWNPWSVAEVHLFSGCARALTGAGSRDLRRSRPSRRGRFSGGLVFAAYLALSVAFLWPLSMRPFDSFAYVGDSLATVYFLAENGRRLWSEPWALFSAGVAYPHANAALFEAHRLLPAFLAAPIVALTGNPILATNLLGFIAYAFNAWAARRLALTLGISPVASFSAGALFAFNTYAVLEQPRLNIVFLGFIPLAIVETIAFARSGAPKHAWRMTGLWLAQAYTENYWLVYGGFVILPVLGVALAASGDAGKVPRRLRTFASPALVAGLAFLPMALAYERMDGIYDYRREAPYSMDLSHFVATQPGNLLYGKIGPPVRAQQQSAHFVGFGALVLALGAVGSALRKGEERPGVGLRGRRPDRGLRPPRRRPDHQPVRAWAPAGPLRLALRSRASLRAHTDPRTLRSPRHASPLPSGRPGDRPCGPGPTRPVCSFSRRSCPSSTPSVSRGRRPFPQVATSRPCTRG